METDIQKTLRETCISIANEITYPSKDDEWWKEWLEYHAEDWGDDESTEPHAQAYLHDALDVEVISGLDGTYLGARIAVGLGGPSFYINTRWNRVEGYWGNEEYDTGFTDNLGIDDYLEEYWQVSR